MKFSIHTRLILALALLTSSCSDECMHEEVATATDNAICFTFDKPATTRTLLSENYESTWQIGDEVGVYAAVTGGTLSATASENFLHNVKLTYDGTTWQPEEKLYWPNTGGTFDFYAYYPYRASATDPSNIVFSVEANQSTLTSSSQSDLLASEKVTKSAGEIVNLPFQHMLAMVELQIPYKLFNPNEIAAGTDINPSATTVASLRRINAQCSLNLITRDVSNTPIDNWGMSNMWQNIKMYRVEQPSDFGYEYAYTYRALLPAQTLLTRDRLFLFVDDSQDLLQLGYDVETEITLNKGTVTKMKCSLVDGGDEVVPIPAGEYYMGSTPEDIITYSGYASEIRHKVTLTKPFLMGTYEVTCSRFAEFVNTVDVEWDGLYASGENPDKKLLMDYANKEYEDVTREIVANGLAYNETEASWEPNLASYNNCPITYVSWFGCYEYAKWIGASLPTEAQWEYACRAGETDYYTFPYWDYDNDGVIDNTLDDYAWNSSNSGGDTHVVGLKQPNAWGLYDMLGNVYEYCSDLYNANYYTSETMIDPTGPTQSSHTSDLNHHHVMRGGSWYTPASRTRSGHKFYAPNFQATGGATVYSWGMDSHFGFRIVKNLE